jgi:hypothetical protein
MRWAGHVACMREMREMHIKFQSRNLKRRDYMGVAGIDWRIKVNFKDKIV